MWLEFLILLSTLISLGLFYSNLTLRRRSEYWTSKGIPFIQKGTTWMELLTFKKTIFDQNYYSQIKQLKTAGGYGGIHDQGSHALFITDPDLIRSIFVKHFDHFVDRRDFIITSDPMMTKMLVNLHGEEWKNVRSFLSPTFTSGKLRRMFPQFDNSGKRLQSHVEKLPKIGNDSHIVQINELARRFTVDVIGSTVFGIETGALTEENPIFYRLAAQATNPNLSMWLYFKIFLCYFTPKLANVLRIKPFDTDVTNYFKGILTTALKQRENSKEKRDDFLQLMVESRMTENQDQDQGQQDNDENGESAVSRTEGFKMSDDMIMAQCFLFFFAGFDTVANLITLCCYVLAADPELQVKVRNNVETAVEESGGGEINYDSAAKMDLLDMFIAETQRMYQSSPRLERKCTKPWPLPGTNFTIPQGMMVLTDPESIHFDPEHYPNPDQFLMERFSTEAKALRNPYTYMVWGQGSRNCVGMRFALIETKVALAHLVKNFELLPTPKTPIPIKMERVWTVTRAPKDLQICLKFRSNNK